VVIGPVSKFGTIELTIARRSRPVMDLLVDSSGRPSARTVAQRLVRRIEDEAQHSTGARIIASCTPDISAIARPLVGRLIQRLGARLELVEDSSLTRDGFSVRAQ
jgi:hypothetical protein